MSNTLAVLNNNRELAPLVHNNEVVITTKMLAEVYECEDANIKVNFNSNKAKFIEGKHYYKLTGEQLKNLRVSNPYLQISPKARTLYLWTKRGASRHCKMLGTDKAWDMFDVLEENYFNPKRQPQQVLPVEQIAKIATEAATKQVMVMMKPIIDRLDKIVQGVNAPRSEQLTFDTSDLPYTATNIGKKINRTASVTNKILLQRGILSVKDGSWTLNKQYEDKGWGKTVKGQYRGKTYVRYTEKGMQEITKILSRSSNQEQIKLF